MCDGTENSFFECKYDRSQTPENLSELFAIIARCIGKQTDDFVISLSKTQLIFVF